MLKYRGFKLQWSRERKLDKASKIGYNINISYKYDENSVRTQKNVNGITTDFITSGIKVLAQKSGDNTIVWQIDGNGNTVGFNYNGTPYFYIKNAQGDIIAIADISGNLVAKYTYDSWGKLVSIKDSNDVDKTTDENFIGCVNPIRYRGYYYDSETGFYYLNARYYDPEVGRFINADGTLDVGYNLFEYSGNNSINFADYTGEKMVKVDYMSVLSYNPYEHGKEYNCLGYAIQKITGVYKQIELRRETKILLAIQDVIDYIHRNTTATVEVMDHVPDSTERNRNQYFIAMRVSQLTGDAHFIRSNFGNGPLVWTHKQGPQGPLLKLVGITPEDDRAWYSYQAIPVNDGSIVAGTDNIEPNYSGPTTYLRITVQSSCIIF